MCHPTRIGVFTAVLSPPAGVRFRSCFCLEPRYSGRSTTGIDSSPAERR
ncbi:hypothetical protein NJ7G_3356 [Natrinema sp. J7-2]|nr:hypothetical protein NJ7G_3356 [Natrinema sp. J7-2]